MLLSAISFAQKNNYKIDTLVSILKSSKDIIFKDSIVNIFKETGLNSTTKGNIDNMPIKQTNVNVVEKMPVASADKNMVYNMPISNGNFSSSKIDRAVDIKFNNKDTTFFKRIKP